MSLDIISATGAMGLGGSGALGMLVSALLPGLGLGLLKGMFIAELLKTSSKKNKGYGHHQEGYGHDHKQRQDVNIQPYSFNYPEQYEQYPYSGQF